LKNELTFVAEDEVVLIHGVAADTLEPRETTDAKTLAKRESRKGGR